MLPKTQGLRTSIDFIIQVIKDYTTCETANDIAKRKGLRYREDILDNMGSEELGANLFRITQTEASLREDNILGESNANETHYNIGKNIREAIKKNNRTMPEDLRAPDKSLKEIERDNFKIKNKIE